MYDPTNAKFISEDPLGFEAEGTNLSAYVLNNPINYTDPYGEDLYSVLNTTDKFAAGFADTVTLGLSTKFREAAYGDLAANNHNGGVFNAGRVVGAGTMLLTGFNTPGNFAAGLSWAQKAAIGYEVASTGYGAYDSTTRIMQGCADWTDTLSFLPLAGYGAGRAWDGFAHPSQLGAIDDWLSAGAKNGVKRNLAALRSKHFKNNSTVFYHGTEPSIANNIRNNGIDLSYGRNNADFGAGFYTSTQKDTALWSANRLYENADTVNFRVSNSKLDQLDHLTFDSPSGDWADFVSFHKTYQPNDLMHGGEAYDMVTGPLFRRFDKKGIPLDWNNRTQTSINTQEAVDLFNRNIR